MKVALVYDWLNVMRGGERALESLCEIFPQAHLYTLFHRPGTVSPLIENRPIYTSFFQKLPQVQKYYRYLLPLMPRAIEHLKATGYDLVISSSHSVAKGISITGTPASPRPPHICYCFTPMRYLYDQFENYFGNENPSYGWMTRTAAKSLRSYLTRWDFESNRDVDYFVAISDAVRQRIAVHYGREAVIIHPPVDTNFFTPPPAERPGVTPYFLVVSALVPYKRIDLAIQACAQIRVPLKIIGDGPEEKKLKGLAQGSQTEFLGRLPPESIRDHYRNCLALLHPQEEDFGIAAVEAMACGKPVVAYGKGGALETVLAGETGIFFYEQTPESLAEAIKNLKKLSFQKDKIRERAILYRKEVFKKEFQTFVDKILYNASSSHTAKSLCAIEPIKK